MKTSGVSNEKSKFKPLLKFSSLFAIGVGVVVGQGPIVSLLQGVGLGGTDFILVLVIGLIIALCNAFTFAELSLMFPSAGSLSTYTEVAMGHFPAILATMTGYVMLTMFGLSAEVMLVGAVMDMLFPGIFSPLMITFIVIGLFTFLNILGTDIFANVQSALTYVMLVFLTIVSVVALSQTGNPIPEPHTAFADWGAIDGSFLGLIALGMWAYFGLEFVCPLIEESKNPARDIPRAMIMGALAIFIIYTLFALGAGTYISREALLASPVPHFDYFINIFGETSKWILAVVCLTASGSTVNTVLAGVSRMLYGMAENGQAFGIFKKVHPKFKTPWVAILFMGSITLLPTIFLGDDSDAIITLLIAAAATWLFAYAVAHVDVLILRKIAPDRFRPFKTPLYPLPQIIGIVTMVYLFINNSPTPEMTQTIYTLTGGLMISVAIIAAIWVKFVMKKGLFEREPMMPPKIDLRVKK
ncbi:APC family permease [Psychrobacter sp. I-STPA10]|uniref:APC family permease n=1 Tax=Psychrobacter sp. I-STPA10 TaxID=2585769 RepID=UPI001E51D147|nr:APC family permease [Psychrobacter sp. I-STPA10]